MCDSGLVDPRPVSVSHFENTVALWSTAHTPASAIYTDLWMRPLQATSCSVADRLQFSKSCKGADEHSHTSFTSPDACKQSGYIGGMGWKLQGLSGGAWHCTPGHWMWWLYHWSEMQCFASSWGEKMFIFQKVNLAFNSIDIIHF